MISTNNLKRSRDSTSPDPHDHKQLNTAAQPVVSVEVHTVPRIVDDPSAKKTRTGLSNGTDSDQILIVQHIVCVPCDQLYTLQGDMDPQRECVSVPRDHVRRVALTTAISTDRLWQKGKTQVL
jgi:hypothetical protein